jgi:hypothetical protein
LTARIHHAIDEADQVLMEQVTWSDGRRRHQDPESRLRLLFPQELTHFLTLAGFRDVEILGDFRKDAHQLRGRRMVTLARRV